MANCVPFPLTTTATTNLVRINGGSQEGNLCGWVITNTAAYSIFVKLWWSGTLNTAPVVGTTVPTITITCPAASTTTGGNTNNLANPCSGQGTLWMWVTKLAPATDTTVTAVGDGILTILVQ